MSALQWTLVVGVVVAAGALIWRLVSRRASHPCPYWLVPLLENPYMNAVAGSALLLDRAHVSEGMKVVDVGCGPGRVTLPAARRVGPAGEVVGLDIQQEMLAKVQSRLDDQALNNVRLIQAGIGDGKLQTNTYDRALLVTVLGEIPDRPSALREIYAALRTGGILSVTEVLPDPHYQTRSSVRNLAKTAGFRFEAAFGTVLAFTMNFRKEEAARL